MKIIHVNEDGFCIVTMHAEDWRKLSMTTGWPKEGAETEPPDPGRLKPIAERLRDAIDKEFPR